MPASEKIPMLLEQTKGPRTIVVSAMWSSSDEYSAQLENSLSASNRERVPSATRKTIFGNFDTNQFGLVHIWKIAIYR
jgi:hypothetical protein